MSEQKINYEKKYKKLSKELLKFLDKYSWGSMEYLNENTGIGVGYLDDEDAPDHVTETNKLYKLLMENK